MIPKLKPKTAFKREQCSIIVSLWKQETGKFAKSSFLCSKVQKCIYFSDILGKLAVSCPVREPKQGLLNSVQHKTFRNH